MSINEALQQYGVPFLVSLLLIMAVMAYAVAIIRGISKEYRLGFWALMSGIGDLLMAKYIHDSGVTLDGPIWLFVFGFLLGAPHMASHRQNKKTKAP